MKRMPVLLLVLAVATASSAFAGSAPDFLIRVERRASDDLRTLRLAGLHVVHETLSSLFLEGGEAELTALTARGFEAAVLDRNPRSWDYLQVGIRPESDVATVLANSVEVFAEENWKIVRVSPGTSLEGLASARVFLTRLSHEAMGVPDPRGSATAGALVWDPLIQQIVNGVRTTSIDTYWSDLVTNPPSGTRFSWSQGCQDAAAYCRGQLEAAKIPAEFQTYSSSNAPNVIGTHRGAITPERVYIVIGHLDDMPFKGTAPGADDNASGSVTVLESARAMSCYAFRSTIKFIACTGEEVGLLGSEAYAADARARGEDIRGVLNFDMNGWQGDLIPNPENLDLNFNDASQDLASAFVQSAANYGTGLAVDAFLCPSLSASDHYSFWRQGYKALCGITDNEGYCGHEGHYPYYHGRGDTIANCGNRSFFYSTVRATVATLATLAEPFKITFATPSLSCGESVRLVLGDRDLNTSAATSQTVPVEVWSAAETTPETILLTEEGVDSMIFSGSVRTSSGPSVHGDGVVAVGPSDALTARYVDVLDCNGAAGVNSTAGATVTCAGIAPAEVSGLTLGKAVSTRLEWQTLASADRYDVAGGVLSELLADASWDRALCLADDLTANAWDDTREPPLAGEAFYYLVRGENAFGVGSFGAQSDGTPRAIAACP